MLAWLRSVFARTETASMRSLERRLDDVEDQLSTVLTRLASVRGQLLTLSRRITRVQLEVDPDEYDDDDDDAAELDDLIRARRNTPNG